LRQYTNTWLIDNKNKFLIPLNKILTANSPRIDQSFRLLKMILALL